MLETTLYARPSFSRLTTANFGSRLSATIIDLFLLTILVFLFKIAFPDISNVLFFKKNAPPVTGGLTQWVLIKSSVIWVWIIYSMIMDCTAMQGTVGKQIMRIIVTNDHGNRLTIIESIKRNLFKVISYTFAGLGFLFILIDKDNKGWHDRIANTLVIQKRF